MPAAPTSLSPEASARIVASGKRIMRCQGQRRRRGRKVAQNMAHAPHLLAPLVRHPCATRAPPMRHPCATFGPRRLSRRWSPGDSRRKQLLSGQLRSAIAPRIESPTWQRWREGGARDGRFGPTRLRSPTRDSALDRSTPFAYTPPSEFHASRVDAHPIARRANAWRRTGTVPPGEAVRVMTSRLESERLGFFFKGCSEEGRYQRSEWSCLERQPPRGTCSLAHKVRFAGSGGGLADGL